MLEEWDFQENQNDECNFEGRVKRFQTNATLKGGYFIFKNSFSSLWKKITTETVCQP